MVLGTALSAFSPEQAAAQAPEAPLQAISDLGRYCTTCWRNARLPADLWGDCTQEVFTRLLERVPTSSWEQALRADGEEHREFLRAIDAVKKRTQRARKFSGAVESAPDRREPHDRRLAEDREAVRRAAEELLSPRQQRILQLSFEGWSVQEVSRELNMPVERVSDEKYKAVRKLRAHLAVEPEGAESRPASGLSA
jgi:RNA polymerase sigma factor (sigma-70 family)